MDKNNRNGVGQVLLAYILWGMMPIFWGFMSDVAPFYILAQRVVWSAILMGCILMLQGRGGEIRKVLTDKNKMAHCLLYGILITVNWGIYIYAVNSGRVLDSSLGYFVEPLVVVLLGIIAFKERPNRYEIVAIVLSAVGLVYMIIATHTIPVLSLLMALTFAVYGAVKKHFVMEPALALFSETMCVTIFALIYIFYADFSGLAGSAALPGIRWILFPLCGVATSIPLLLFNLGTKKIPYYLSGIILYVSPTIQFFIAIFYFHEAMMIERLIAFCIIWLGIAVAIWGDIRKLKSETA